jgi:hypothetical protein
VAKGKQVPGFDYTTGKPVSMTAAEWREKYKGVVRLTTGANGETWYKARSHVHGMGKQPGQILAEAYAIIPEGK